MPRNGTFRRRHGPGSIGLMGLWPNQVAENRAGRPRGMAADIECRRADVLAHEQPVLVRCSAGNWCACWSCS